MLIFLFPDEIKMSLEWIGKVPEQNYIAKVIFQTGKDTTASMQLKVK
jgi:hypothetical protein